MKKIILGFLFFVTTLIRADISTTSVSVAGHSTTNSLIFSMAVPSGSNRILGVYVLSFMSTNSAPVVKIGGVNLTLARSAPDINPDVFFFYMVNPPVGTNNVLVSNLTQYGGVAQAVVWNGVNQITPFGNIVVDDASNNIFPRTVTTPTGSVVWDFMAGAYGGMGAGQTAINQNLGTYYAQSSVKPSAGAITPMTWTVGEEIVGYLAVPLLVAP
jgi:hypothetical protein